MEVELNSTKKILVLSLDKRTLENLAWCASTYGVNRLYWTDGYLLCLEVYEKSLEHEIKTKEYPISQLCYTQFPKYTRTYEVERGVQLPIVNASDMRIFQDLQKAILRTEEKGKKESEP